MAMKDSSQSDELITEINITPFVDVVLVLLILFMLAAPAVYQAGVRIQLPTAASAEEVKHVTLKFSLDMEGTLSLDGGKLTEEKLKARVQRALELDPRADAMLIADRALTHGQVMERLDSIKEAGIRNIALAAEKARAR